MANRFGMEYGDNANGGGTSSWGGENNNTSFNSDMGSPSGSEKRRTPTDAQTLIPVTVRMVINSTGTTLSDGREPHQVKLVAAVREVADQSTSNVYTIEDGTGMIDVKEWVDANHDNSAVIKMRAEATQDNIYVRIIGKISEYEGRKQVVAYSVRKLSTCNEFTHHMLEVVHSAEKSKKKDQIVGSPNFVGSTMMNNNATNTDSYGNMGAAPVSLGTDMGGGGNDMISELEAKILHFVRENSSDGGGQGVEIKDYLERRPKTDVESEIEVRKMFKLLAADGNIFSTIDEDHYSAV